jgi:hypothetical protein
MSVTLLRLFFELLVCQCATLLLTIVLHDRDFFFGCSLKINQLDCRLPRLVHAHLAEPIGCRLKPHPAQLRIAAFSGLPYCPSFNQLPLACHSWRSKVHEFDSGVRKFFCQGIEPGMALWQIRADKGSNLRNDSRQPLLECLGDQQFAASGPADECFYR